ncbi:MAG: NfeD family protein [Chloroflexota bacterium]
MGSRIRHVRFDVAARVLTAFGLAWLGVSAFAGPIAFAADPTSSPTSAPAPAGDPTSPVYVVTANGVVDSVLAGYIESAIDQAEAAHSPAIIVQLDTPGGDLSSTGRITSALLEAKLPTIVWVSPSGGRAASAGTFITLAANLAYMETGTNIGAASPVGQGGAELEGTIGKKVLNDAMNNIKAIAEERGRNVDWAVSTVEKAVSASASEALGVHAIDGIASSLEDVRRQADGQIVSVDSRPVVVDIADAPFVDLPMNPFQSIIHLLSDPNVAFILLTLGFYGLLFELLNPNFVTGIVGAIALILAFVGFGSLPLNLAGVLLIGLAVVLFILEFTVTSHGLLAVAGLICFVLGAFTLYTAPGTPTAPDVTVAAPLVVGMAILTAAYVGLVLFTVVRARRRGDAFAGLFSAGGTSTVPAGSEAVVKTALEPLGVVYAAGEEWTARSESGAGIDPGSHVRVVGQEGLTLIVDTGSRADAASEGRGS